MKKLIFITLLLSPLMLVAQTINVENKKVVDYFKKGASYNCTYENELFVFKVKLVDTLKYKFTLNDSVDTSLLKDIDNARIVGIIVETLISQFESTKAKTYDKNCIPFVSSSLYRKIIDDIVRLNIAERITSTNENEINIGSIVYLPKNNIVICHEKKLVRKRIIAKNITEDKPHDIKIEKISIAFEDGVIKDMILNGEIRDTLIQFKNYKSFSVRNPINIGQLNGSSNYLYSDYKNKHLIINLCDIISYKRNVISGSGTYIPKNDTININGKTRYVKLYKDSYINNFDIRIFSDVTGLRGNSSNGILQFDCKSDFILSTQSLLYGNIFSNKATSENSLFLFNKITPYIQFTKIENDEKSLLLSKYINDTLQEKSFNYSSSFELFKHSNLNIGVDLNFLTLLTQSKKIRLDLSAGLFRTRVDSTLSVTKKNSTFEATTISDQRNLLSWYLMPELGILFIESDRIEFEIKYGFIMSKLVDKTVKQIKMNTQNVTDIGDSKFFESANWINKIQCNVNVHPNPKKRESSIFMRATYYFNRNDNNLSIQLGYATSITNLFNQFNASEK